MDWKDKIDAAQLELRSALVKDGQSAALHIQDAIDLLRQAIDELEGE